MEKPSCLIGLYNTHLRARFAIVAVIQIDYPILYQINFDQAQAGGANW